MRKESEIAFVVVLEVKESKVAKATTQSYREVVELYLQWK